MKLPKTICPVALLVLVAAAGSAAAQSTPAPTAAEAAPRLTAVTARAVLKVVHPEQVRAELAAKARELGGFPILVADDALAIKVPPDRLGALLDAVAGRGFLLEKTLSREDITQTIADLEGQLRSKDEILERLRSLFDGSDLEATLGIEQRMTEIVSELEQVKGALRVARDRARFAVVEIAFNFQERDRVVYVASPFEWINTVDLDRFLSEFEP